MKVVIDINLILFACFLNDLQITLSTMSKSADINLLKQIKNLGVKLFSHSPLFITDIVIDSNTQNSTKYEISNDKIRG